MIRMLLLVLLVAADAHATTYYVTTSGSDTTGTGAIGNPWRNPQKCVNAGSPLVAGDTCLVGDGTYTDTDGNGITVYASSSATTPVGTLAAPITIKSENPLGAIIMVRQDSTSTQAGFYISRNYYIIEGFEIDGRGDGTPLTTTTQTGIAMWGSGGIIRRNKIHDIGREFCSNSVNGMSGVYLGTGTADIVVHYNEIYTIGRKRGVPGFQEDGCALTPGSQGGSAHDHGIYPSQSTRLVIERNVIWDAQRGYAVHIYRSSATSNPDTRIEHNTFHGEGAIGVGPTTQILVNNAMSNALIRNNIFSSPRTEVAFPFNVTFSGTSVFAGNHTTVSTWWKTSTPSGINMSSPGSLSATMGFTNSGSQDFSLTSTSTAIDTGVSTGAVSSGSAEDRGAFEKFSITSASINEQSLDVVTDAAFLPLQPTSGTTGWSVGCTGSGCGAPTVSDVAAIGTGNTLRLIIAGITGTNCAVGQTWTVTYNAATGTVTDSINIGSHLNQPMHSVTTFSVTNGCSGAPPTSETYTLETHRWEGVYLTAAGAVDVRSALAADAKCIAGGSIALHLQIKCDNVADCPSTAFPLYYSVDGGAYTNAVPNVATSDGVRMYGLATDSTLNRFAADGPLSGVLTHTDGTTTMIDITESKSYALSQNTTLTVRYLLSFTSDAVNKTFRFRPKYGSTTDLQTYTVSPRVDIVPAQASGGP